MNTSEINALTPLEAALHYADLGRPVLPIIPGDKRPLIRWSAETYPPGWVPDKTTIREWWQRWPGAGVGMRCDGLIVLDNDPPYGYQSLRTLENRLGELPETKLVVSGSLGQQRFFRLDQETAARIPQAQGLLGLPNLDLRVGTRGVVVLPPTVSRHAGRLYRWKSFNTPTADLPPEWIDAVTPAPPAVSDRPIIVVAEATRYGRAMLKKELEKLAAAERRTDSLWIIGLKCGSWIAGGHLPYEETRELLIEAGIARGIQPRRARYNVDRGLARGMQSPRGPDVSA